MTQFLHLGKLLAVFLEQFGHACAVVLWQGHLTVSVFGLSLRRAFLSERVVEGKRTLDVISLTHFLDVPKVVDAKLRLETEALHQHEEFGLLFRSKDLAQSLKTCLHLLLLADQTALGGHEVMHNFLEVLLDLDDVKLLLTQLRVLLSCDAKPEVYTRRNAFHLLNVVVLVKHFRLLALAQLH